MGLNGFYWVSLDLRRSVQGSMVLNGFYPFFKGVTGLHWVLLGFTGFYWVLLGFTGFSVDRREMVSIIIIFFKAKFE